MNSAQDNSRIYERNATVLRTRYPDAYRIITDDRADTTALTVHRTKTGGIEITSGDKTAALHSKIDPVREARRIADSVMDGSEQVVVLIGFGLGYHVEEMLRKNGQTRFIVIEPDRHIFIQALKVRDLSGMLESERVMLFVEPDTVPFDEVIPDIPAGAMKFYVPRPYSLIFPEKTEELKQAFLNFRNKTDINTATLNRFDRLWTKNTFKNCRYFFTLNGVNALKDSLKGFAALVLAAGPSLDEDIEEIRRIEQNVFIVAADSALRPLLGHGIVPDFVVTVDPQFINSFHIAGPLPKLNGGETPILVADPAVHPSILRNYNGITVLSSSVFSPGRLIEDFSGSKGHIAAGGSVATAAFDFARTTGADPIIVAGLDLSYTKGKTHLSGSFIEEYILSKAHRFKTVLSFYAEYIRSGRPSTAADRRGRCVFTDKRLLLYKSWFENRPYSNGRTILNATRGGLSIRGMHDIEFKRIRRFISNGPEKKEERRAALNTVLKSPGTKTARILRFTAFLQSAGKNLRTLQSLSRKGSSITGLMLENNADIPTGYKELASVDEEILSFGEENLLISMVLQSPIHQILAGKARNKREALKNSMALYTAINKAAETVIDLIELAKRKVAKYAN